MRYTLTDKGRAALEAERAVVRVQGHLVCNVCDRRSTGLRAGDDCPTEGCAGAVYFDVPGVTRGSA